MGLTLSYTVKVTSGSSITGSVLLLLVASSHPATVSLNNLERGSVLSLITLLVDAIET